MELGNYNKIHFIGIGGIGMSAVAWILVKMGFKVSGSDLSGNKMTARLAENGAEIFKGHEAKNVENAEAVVISSAIKDSNPELKYAKEHKLPVFHRSDVLAWILSRGDAVTVAGTHGKTTTTSMTSFLLEHSGLNPMVIIGGELNDFGGNAKFSSGNYIIAEADESDGTFVKYNPLYAIVTNIEPDHLDHYGTFDKIIAAFKKHLSGLRDDGTAFLCIDDPEIKKLLPDINKKYKTYSITSSDADYHAENIQLLFGGSSYTFASKSGIRGEIVLTVPGKHNIANSLAAIAVALECGVPFEKIAGTIRSFKNAGRRFEIKGIAKGITVIDDYAHHPTEIAATIKALDNIPNNGRGIVIFQPHRYSRTFNHHKEFAEILGQAEILYLTDVYAAGEDPIPNVSGESIFNDIPEDKSKIRTYIQNKEELAESILPILKEGDVVITVGAGDVWKTGMKILDKLNEQNLM